MRKTFDRSNETGERCKRFGEWDVAMGGQGEREGMDGRVSRLRTNMSDIW